MQKTMFAGLVLLMLSCMATASFWDNWNNQTLALGARPALAAAPFKGYWKSFAPYGQGRWAKAPAQNLTQRKNQYLFRLGGIKIQSAYECSIECGIQSFPFYDGDNLVCFRNTYYWYDNVTLNANGDTYPRLCVPDIRTWVGTVCDSFAPSLNSSASGGCNPNQFTGGYAGQDYECCYDNSNPNAATPIADQVDRLATTNYDNKNLTAILYNTYQ